MPSWSAQECHLLRTSSRSGPVARSHRVAHLRCTWWDLSQSCPVPHIAGTLPSPGRVPFSMRDGQTQSGTASAWQLSRNQTQPRCKPAVELEGAYYQSVSSSDYKSGFKGSISNLPIFILHIVSFLSSDFCHPILINASSLCNRNSFPLLQLRDKLFQREMKPQCVWRKESKQTKRIFYCQAHKTEETTDLLL